MSEPSEWLIRQNSLVVANVQSDDEFPKNDFEEAVKKFGKCSITYDDNAKEVTLFFAHHKGAKKAKDTLNGAIYGNTTISVNWKYIRREKSDSEGSKKDQENANPESKSKAATKKKSINNKGEIVLNDSIVDVLVRLTDVDSVQKKLDDEIKSRIKLDSKVQVLQDKLSKLTALIESKFASDIADTNVTEE